MSEDNTLAMWLASKRGDVVEKEADMIDGPVPAGAKMMGSYARSGEGMNGNPSAADAGLVSQGGSPINGGMGALARRGGFIPLNPIRLDNLAAQQVDANA